MPLAKTVQPGRWLQLLPLLTCVLILAAGCTSGTEGAEDGQSGPPTTSEPADTASPTPSGGAAGEALAAYQDYLSAFTGALAAGDTGAAALSEHAAGAALENAREQLRANQSEGLTATGTIQSAVTDSEVAVDGDRATVEDCVLNDLAHVRVDNPDEVVAPASGNRQPITAVLDRTAGSWQVAAIEGPPLRGPNLEAESCAPPELEDELLARYRAYWDAVRAAGDPGSGQPANPDDPRLSDTSLDPQLSDWRAAFTELRAANQVLRGQQDRSPSVLGVFNYDQFAVVVDCAIETEGSGIVDVVTGEVVQAAEPGLRTSELAEMRTDGGTWKVSNWDIVEEGACEQQVG